MPHLPDWVIERLLRSGLLDERQVEPERWEPVRVPDEEDPLVRVVCPDPDCAAPFRVYRSDLPDHYVLPAHCTAPDGNLTLDPRCWLSGCHILDAREIIRMREENGGRLKRAAHP